MRARVSAAGAATPAQTWARYERPARWTGWAPHLTAVDASTAVIAPGTQGCVTALWLVRARFAIDGVDPARRRWSWRVRLGPIRLALRHDVRAQIGGGAIAGVDIEGPAVVVAPYLPVMRWTLARLVAASSFHDARRGSLLGPTRDSAKGAAMRTGSRVSWNTSHGTTHGTIIERRTKDFQLNGQRYTASEDEPMFIVESAKTGARAAHRESALEPYQGDDA